jgi:DNA-binding response OmpR family regulator
MTKKILIIEDDINFLSSLQAKLSVEGFLVQTAKDGQEALHKLNQNIDLIVLDILLPDMSGFEVLQRIKSEPGIKEIPVVIVSNLSDQESQARGLKLGVKDYIVKPDYKIDQIVEKIKNLVQ